MPTTKQPCSNTCCPCCRHVPHPGCCGAAWRFHDQHRRDHLAGCALADCCGPYGRCGQLDGRRKRWPLEWLAQASGELLHGRGFANRIRSIAHRRITWQRVIILILEVILRWGLPILLVTSVLMIHWWIGLPI